MIYITGDIHGSVSVGSRFNTKNFPQGKTLTKQDYIIIVGDFGLLWADDAEDRFWLKWLTNKPWTTLFIDGNHENFNLLESYPVSEWNGGNVHHITPSIIHLMRGQVFEIEGKKFFTFGGSASHDKEYRKVDVSWWEREMPSSEEYQEGIRNLDKNHWVVDYVLTHTCSHDALTWIIQRYNTNVELDQMHKYFNVIKSKLEYEKWFFGHFHHDDELPDNQRLLYNDKIKIL
ncbi:metallophosphoesterase family protein [Paenibacillus donghaensis]|uniref:Metallophosphatase n=1 Tax=Paenibacillus donghaensis TaxID=414771 RepID=A0A2Z2KHD5_9BACL|nr:metallophosphoesterase family protein [Paenibacillus donghaensis]ASA22663.1 metallophosphatase [Paenibacillus donghaensis]